jgi:hypothetical protein
MRKRHFWRILDIQITQRLLYFLRLRRRFTANNPHSPGQNEYERSEDQGGEA